MIFFFLSPERLKCDSNQCLLILVVNLSVFTIAAVWDVKAKNKAAQEESL